MLRLLRKFKVSILVILAAVCFLVWWNGTRGYDDTAMAAIPELTGVDESSVLEDGGSKLEASYPLYYSDWKEKGAKDASDFNLMLSHSSIRPSVIKVCMKSRS